MEYLAEIIPGAQQECAGCPLTRKVGDMVTRDGKLYHSQECADRSCAKLDRNRGDVVIVDNWKI